LFVARVQEATALLLFVLLRGKMVLLKKKLDFVGCLE